MADEDKDLNSAQLVAEQDLNNADVVNQQDLNAQSVTEEQDDTLADGTLKDKTVKYSEFEKANIARKQAEEAAAYAQRQLEIYQANIAAQQQVAQQPQINSTYELAMNELSLTPDDLYDGNNQLKVQRRKAELDMALMQQQNANLVNQQFMASHSDFGSVVGSVNPATGTIMSWSQEALALQQKKPWLAGAFQTAQGSYEAVMQERKLLDLETKAAVNKEFLNRQGVDTNTQPLGGSSVGGGGGDVQNPALMTRAQVQEIQDKLDRGEDV